jgi:hypothetical protein
MTTPFRLIIALVALVAIGSAMDSDHAQAGGGEIRVEIDTIVGQKDRILLGFARPAGGGDAIARICMPIESTEFSLGQTALTAVPLDNPCGDPTAPVLFAFGEWQVTAGVYVGGQQQPVKQVTAEITVNDAIVTLQLDGAALSVDTPGDADCNREVNALDALGDLREIGGLGSADCAQGGGNLKCDDGLDARDALFILRFAASLSVNLPGGCPAPLGPPTLLSPADGANVGPYDATNLVPLDWTDVPGAYGYAVQIDCFHCCVISQFCADAGWGYPVFHLVGGSEDAYNAVAANTVRWRVWTLVADGVPGASSPWREFHFD